MTARRLALATALAAWGGGPAWSAIITATYVCERGIEVPAAYVGGEGASAAVVLNVEGRQIALEIGRSGSGARYEWPSDGSGYVWWVKGNAATLYWRDGAAGTETVLHSDCVTSD